MARLAYSLPRDGAREPLDLLSWRGACRPVTSALNEPSGIIGRLDCPWYTSEMTIQPADPGKGYEVVEELTFDHEVARAGDPVVNGGNMAMVERRLQPPSAAPAAAAPAEDKFAAPPLEAVDSAPGTPASEYEAASMDNLPTRSETQPYLEDKAAAWGAEYAPKVNVTSTGSASLSLFVPESAIAPGDTPATILDEVMDETPELTPEGDRQVDPDYASQFFMNLDGWTGQVSVADYPGAAGYYVLYLILTSD